VNVVGEHQAEGLTQLHLSVKNSHAPRRVPVGMAMIPPVRVPEYTVFSLFLRESQRLSGPKSRKVLPGQPVDATPSNRLIRPYFL
jgi:hypothetical protein